MGLGTHVTRAPCQGAQNNAGLKEKVNFVQICGRSRIGILAYDQYWNECQALTTRLNEKFSINNWQPVITIEDHLSSSDLALLYSNASVMVVNPLKDGLNLTAKEFVACQKEGTTGALALSPGAGVFEEFGNYAIAIDPRDPKQMAQTLYSCLSMPQSEKDFRTIMLTEQLKRSSLDNWSRIFTKRLEAMPSNLALANSNI